jgi:hypothetical protein
MRASSRWQLPLEEVSALCLSDGGASVVAVGDDHWCFGAAAIGAAGLTPAQPATVDGRPAAERGSEFEGVAADGSGRLFILREGPALILVLDRDGGVERTVALRVPANLSVLGAEWNDAAKANSRGEGLLLLRDGHILVAKQRDSTWLIEFGPAGEPPSGFGSASALRAGEPFALGAATTEMVPLATWRVDQADFRSINDLAVDAGGRLWLISSRSRRLATLAHDLDPGGGTARLVSHDLPAELFVTEDDKAEGLVHTPQLGWLVGLDLDRAGSNVIRLEDVPPA